MKKALLIMLALSAVTLGALSTTAEVIEKEGYISVNESTTREITPNQAEITIGIETSDKSLQVASETNKVTAKKVYSNLKSLLGVNDYIKTGNYTARPIYTYSRDNKQTLDKYVVSNTVTIKTKNVELISKLIDTAIAQGATNVNNLQFSATDYDCECNEALSELTKKAYNKAGSVAKSINNQITGVKSINATCNMDNQRSDYSMMMKSEVGGGSTSTPIESGKLKIHANIDASFFVK